jgi:16S rRNA U1498 N3-methylase RsmE
VREVLKLKPGDSLRVGVVNGLPATATVAACDAAAGLALRWHPGVEESDDDTTRRRLADPVQIDLLLAMPRPKVMTRLWASLASMGVGAVYLTNAARVERYYFDSKALDRGKVEDELLRGLEQSGDTVMPGVCVVKRFPAAMDAIRGDGGEAVQAVAAVAAAASAADGAAEGAGAAGVVTRGSGGDEGVGDEGVGDEGGRSGALRKESASWLIDPPPPRHHPLYPTPPAAAAAAPPVMLMAHPGVQTTLAEALAGAAGGGGTPAGQTDLEGTWSNRPRRVIVAVGPEGGWTEYERRVMLSAGFAEFALGNRTFATDVACIALIAAVRERTESW